MRESNPVVTVCMGSQSDWDVMQPAVETLVQLGISYETLILSAHRTPARLASYALEAHTRGIKVIIAGAGGAAHLPGMLAAQTHLPVIGVPVKSKALSGWDSLLSIAQMPPGIPVGTMAIDGARNAALYAAAILALFDNHVAKRLLEFRLKQTSDVAGSPTRS